MFCTHFGYFLKYILSNTLIVKYKYIPLYKRLKIEQELVLNNKKQITVATHKKKKHIGNSYYVRPQEWEIRDVKRRR